MVLSTETFNQSVRTEYSEAVNARYTFQPLWVSGVSHVFVMQTILKGVLSRLTIGSSEEAQNQMASNKLCAEEGKEPQAYDIINKLMWRCYRIFSFFSL